MQFHHRHLSGYTAYRQLLHVHWEWHHHNLYIVFIIIGKRFDELAFNPFRRMVEASFSWELLKLTEKPLFLFGVWYIPFDGIFF